MPAAVRRLLPLWHFPEGFESKNKFRLPRACIQLGAVCQGTEQNQTRNSVL